MIVRFALVEENGIAVGRLDLEPGETPALAGIRVDLLMLARNDPGALTFPNGINDRALAATLMPHLRMLTRGRIVPLAAELRL